MEHKDELEQQRIEAGESKKSFYVPYTKLSDHSLMVGFCYRAAGAESTGYKKTDRYTYKLDDSWYIEVYLRSPV